MENIPSGLILRITVARGAPVKLSIGYDLGRVYTERFKFRSEFVDCGFRQGGSPAYLLSYAGTRGIDKRGRKAIF
jgi:hypothetical protein